MTDATQPPVFTDNPMNPLEVALYEGMADQSKMGLFERVMLEADLYAVPEAGAPGSTPEEDGTRVLRPNEQMVLRGVVLHDGRKTVTIFTDPRRAVQMFGEDTRIIAMKGRNLLTMMQSHVILLNPAGGRGLLIEPEQAKAILEHEPAPADLGKRPTGSVELSDVPLPQHPITLIARLWDALRGVRIEGAWLARANWMEAQQMGWFLDLRTEAPADEVKALIERGLRGLDFGGEVFDISVSKPGGEDGTGIKL
jgi:hypothetical protein